MIINEVIKEYNVNTVSWDNLWKISDKRQIEVVNFDKCVRSGQMITAVEMLTDCVNIKKINLAESCIDKDILRRIKHICPNVVFDISWQYINIFSDLLNDINSISFEGCNDIKRMYNIIENYVSLCKNLKKIDLSKSCDDGSIVNLLRNNGIEVIPNEFVLKNYMDNERMLEEVGEMHGKRSIEHLSDSINWRDIHNIDFQNFDCIKFVSFYGCNDVKKMPHALKYVIENFTKIKMIDLTNSCVKMIIDYVISIILKNKNITHIIVDDEYVRNAFTNFLDDKIFSNTFTMQEIIDFDVSLLYGIKINIVDTNFDICDDEKLFVLMVNKLYLSGFSYENINCLDFPKNDYILHRLMEKNLIKNVCKDTAITCHNIKSVFHIPKDQLYRVIAINVENSVNSEDISRLVHKYLPLCVNLKFLFFNKCNVEMSHIAGMNELIDKVKYIQINSSNIETNEIIDCAINDKNIGVYSFACYKKINNPILLHELHGDVFKFLNENSIVDVLFNYVSDETIEKFFDNLRKYNIFIKHMNFIGLRDKFDYKISNVTSINIDNSNFKNFDVLSRYIKGGCKVFNKEHMIMYIDNDWSIRYLNIDENQRVKWRINKNIKFEDIASYITENVAVLEFEEVSLDSFPCFWSIKSIHTIIIITLLNNCNGYRVLNEKKLNIIGIDSEFIEHLFFIFPNLKHLLFNDDIVIKASNIGKYALESLSGYVFLSSIRCLPATLKYVNIRVHNNVGGINIINAIFNSAQEWSMIRSCLLSPCHISTILKESIPNAENLKVLHIGDENGNIVVKPYNLVFTGLPNLRELKISNVHISNITLDLPNLKTLTIIRCYSKEWQRRVYDFKFKITSNNSLEELFVEDITHLRNIEVLIPIINSVWVLNSSITSDELFNSNVHIKNLYVIKCKTNGFNISNTCIENLRVDGCILYLNLPRTLRRLYLKNIPNIKVICSGDHKNVFNGEMIDFNKFPELLFFEFDNKYYFANNSTVNTVEINSVDIMVNTEDEILIYSILNSGPIHTMYIKPKYQSNFYLKMYDLKNWANNTLKELYIIGALIDHSQMRSNKEFRLAEFLSALEVFSMKNVGFKEKDDNVLWALACKNLKEIDLQDCHLGDVRFNELHSCRIRLDGCKFYALQLNTCINISVNLINTTYSRACEVTNCVILSLIIKESNLPTFIIKNSSIYFYATNMNFQDLRIEGTNNKFVQQSNSEKLKCKKLIINSTSFDPIDNIIDMNYLEHLKCNVRSWDLLFASMLNSDKFSIDSLTCDDINFKNSIIAAAKVRRLILNKCIGFPIFAGLKEINFGNIPMFSFESLRWIGIDNIKIVVNSKTGLFNLVALPGLINSDVACVFDGVPILIEPERFTRTNSTFFSRYMFDLSTTFLLLVPKMKWVSFSSSELLLQKVRNAILH